MQEALVGMAIIKDKQGYTAQSVPFIEKAIGLYPKSSSCWYVAGEVYNKLEHQEDAYQAYLNADKFNKENNQQIWLDLSNFIAENISITEAIEFSEKHTDNIQVKYRLVAYYLLLGKGKKAYSLLEECLGQDFDAHRNLLEYHEEIMELPEFISLIEGFNS